MAIPEFTVSHSQSMFYLKRPPSGFRPRSYGGPSSSGMVLYERLLGFREWLAERDAVFEGVASSDTDNLEDTDLIPSASNWPWPSHLFEDVLGNNPYVLPPGAYIPPFLESSDPLEALLERDDYSESDGTAFPGSFHVVDSEHMVLSGERLTTFLNRLGNSRVVNFPATVVWLRPYSARWTGRQKVDPFEWHESAYSRTTTYTMLGPGWFNPPDSAEPQDVEKGDTFSGTSTVKPFDFTGSESDEPFDYWGNGLVLDFRDETTTTTTWSAYSTDPGSPIYDTDHDGNQSAPYMISNTGFSETRTLIRRGGLDGPRSAFGSVKIIAPNPYTRLVGTTFSSFLDVTSNFRVLFRFFGNKKNVISEGDGREWITHDRTGYLSVPAVADEQNPSDPWVEDNVPLLAQRGRLLRLTVDIDDIRSAFGSVGEETIHNRSVSDPVPYRPTLTTEETSQNTWRTVSIVGIMFTYIPHQLILTTQSETDGGDKPEDK